MAALWEAPGADHPGASEVGAYGFSCAPREGVHVNEADFIAGVGDPATGQPVEPGGRSRNKVPRKATDAGETKEKVP